MSFNKENLNPAITIPERDEPSEMSAEEFRRSLLAWFEERGLLSDLRAHLRKQMIGILQDTSLGQKTQKIDAKLSPKNHIINLLIAEFLLKNKYHYSLSVFSTEVPFFMNILPEFSSALISSNILNSQVSNARNFSYQNFQDILETLGFATESKEIQNLHETYFQSNENSLLTCMIKLLIKVSKKQLIKNDIAHGSKDDDLNKLEEYLQNIHRLLKHYEVPDNFIIPLRNQLKFVFEQEFNKIKAMEYSKYSAKQLEINKSLEDKEVEIKKLVEQIENNYLKERKKISNDLMKEQEQIEKMRRSLKQKKFELEVKNDAIMKKEEVIKQREREIEEQLAILTTRMKVMENVYDSIISENQKITTLRQTLQKADGLPDDTYIKLHNEYISLRNEIQSTKLVIEKFNKKPITFSDKDQQTSETTDDSETQLLKTIIERLQNENSALRILNTEQQHRIDDLTIRNSVILNELDAAQSRINILTRDNHRGVITVPPLLPSQPNRPTFTRSVNSSLNGGGENLGFNSHVPPPVFRHASQRDFHRRKTPKRFSVHVTSSGSSSPTEDILQEARQRLQRLEEETEEVERHYQAFRERQCRNDNFNTISSIPNPLLRVRESTIRDSFPAFAININENAYRRVYINENNFHNRPLNGITVLSSNYVTRPSTSYVLNPLDTMEGMGNVPELHLQSSGPSGNSSGLSRVRDVSISSVEISSDNESDIEHRK